MIKTVWSQYSSKWLSGVVACLVLFVCGNCFGGWRIGGEEQRPVTLNTETTLTLAFAEGQSTPTSGQLWLHAVDPDSVLVPETVSYNGSRADLSLFVRRPNPVLLVHDPERNETSTVTLSTKVPSGRHGWLPTLAVPPVNGHPVLLANQETTPTLTLGGGDGAMPPSAHLSATDHRGRTVYARFFSTFDLLGGLSTIKLPSTGMYTLRLRLLEDDITSLPQGAQREPEVVPFGKHVERETFTDLEAADYVTTDLVIGSIISLEHIPTTATVLSEDRIKIPVFAVHSRESRMNRWPYMLADAELYDMPIQEQRTEGLRLLQWQQALGATFGRIHVNWADIQVSPGSFRWLRLVNLLPLYRSQRVRPVLSLTDTAAWNGLQASETTETLSAWERFAFELSEKYRHLIWGIQLPESHSVSADDNGSSYSELIASTYEGFSTRDGKPIQAAPVLATVDPQTTSETLQRLAQSKARRAVGGVAFNMYPTKPSASPEDNRMDVEFARMARIVEASGLDLPIWLMNTGWSNSPAGVTEKLQANYLVRAHTMALANGFYKVSWDGLVDETTLPWYDAGTSRTGLLTTDLRLKASGIAYNNMSYLMSGVTARDESRQGSARIFSFNIGLQSNKWPGILYVAWTESPQETQDVLLTMNQGGGVYALDYLGAEISTEKVDNNSDSPLAGTYRIPVGYEPVFIWDAGKPGSSTTPPTESEQEQE